MIVSVLLAALVSAGIYIASHKLDGIKLFIGFTLLFVGVILVVVPDLATSIANVFGVGRGTDLLLYVVTLTGIFVAAHFYFRTERQAKQIAILVREVAILRADLEALSPSD